MLSHAIHWFPFLFLSVRACRLSTPPCHFVGLRWVRTRKGFRISLSTAWLVHAHTHTHAHCPCDLTYSRPTGFSSFSFSLSKAKEKIIRLDFNIERSYSCGSVFAKTCYYINISSILILLWRKDSVIFDEAWGVKMRTLLNTDLTFCSCRT